MKLLLITFMVFLSSCAHSIHQVQTSNFSGHSLKEGNLISSSAEQFVVLGFVTETNYIDQAYKGLQEKCQNREISGITTQYSTKLGFFSWTNKVLMRGICIN